MSKLTMPKKTYAKKKKQSCSVSVRDIINKLEDTYRKADKQLEEISISCSSKDLKCKG